jgi:ABC-type phosphate/phosphonate transport system substrate-binding protein
VAQLRGGSLGARALLQTMTDYIHSRLGRQDIEHAVAREQQKLIEQTDAGTVAAAPMNV